MPGKRIGIPCFRHTGKWLRICLDMWYKRDKPPPEFDPEKVYPNFHKPKGAALIINNQKFVKHGERTGAEKDAKNLKDLFSKLGYKVKLKNDLTRQGMVEVLSKLSLNSNYKNCDSVIICILSHGSMGSLYGSDDKELRIEDILSIMNNECCQLYRGKPKLFFFQACRGDVRDPGEAVVQDGPIHLLETTAEDEPDGEILGKHPKDAHMFMAYSTTPGHVAWRNPEQGSWFITALCDVFTSQAADDDLLSMITEVSRIVSRKNSTSGHMQIPEVISRLTKKFYFYPKWSKPSSTQPSRRQSPEPQLGSQEYVLQSWDGIRQKLKDFYTGSFSFYHIVPTDRSSNVPLDQIWINIRCASRYGSPGDDYKACLMNAKARGYPVIVSGEAGNGKTTLLKRICVGWAQNDLQQYDLVLVAKLRDISTSEDQILDLCLQWLCQVAVLDQNEAGQLKEKIENELDPNRVLIMLDGLDEKVPKCTELLQLFRKDVIVMKYPVVVTTRPYKAKEICCDHHFCKLLPFTNEQQCAFVRKFYELHGKPDDAKNFIENLKASSTKIQATMAVPLNLQLCLVSGYSTNHFSQTDLFIAIFSTMIRTFTIKNEKCCIALENWMESPAIHNLSHLAFDMLQQNEYGKLHFSPSELQEYDVPAELGHIGLLQEDKPLNVFQSPSSNASSSFPHKTFHEFFAALYPATSAEVLKKFMTDVGNDDMLRMRNHQMILFLFGLLNSQGKDHLAEDLLQSVGMKIFPYITENVRYLSNLRHECKTHSQTEAVDMYYLSPVPSCGPSGHPIKHWLNMTLTELQKEFPLHLRTIDEGIFEWEFYDDYINVTILVGIVDGFSDGFTKSPNHSKKLIADYKFLQYSGPYKSLGSFASMLSPAIEVLKIQLHACADTPEEIAWPSLTSLRDLRIDLAHLEPAPTVLPVGVKELVKFLDGKPASFSIRAAGQEADFSELNMMPRSIRYFKLKRLTLKASSISQLSSNMTSWENLEILRIHKCRMQDCDILHLVSSLKQCYSLRDLSFMTIKQIGKLQVLRQAVEHFMKIPKLELLTMQACSISDDAFETLRLLIETFQLKALYIGWNPNKGTRNNLKHLSNRNGDEVLVSFDFLPWSVNYQTASKEVETVQKVPSLHV